MLLSAGPAGRHLPPPPRRRTTLRGVSSVGRARADPVYGAGAMGRSSCALRRLSDARTCRWPPARTVSPVWPSEGGVHLDARPPEVLLQGQTSARIGSPFFDGQGEAGAYVSSSTSLVVPFLVQCYWRNARYLQARRSQAGDRHLTPMSPGTTPSSACLSATAERRCRRRHRCWSSFIISANGSRSYHGVGSASALGGREVGGRTPVERNLETRPNKSNQKGAPIEMAIALTSHPARATYQVLGRASSLHPMGSDSWPIASSPLSTF